MFVSFLVYKLNFLNLKKRQIFRISLEFFRNQKEKKLKDGHL